MSGILRVGAPAPYFKATAYQAGEFKEVSLKDYDGKWVCLFFYPLDFTFVCPTEIKSFADFDSKFKELGCQIIACSTDSQFSHKAWFEKDLPEVKFPVLADSSHQIAKDYGVLMEDAGITLRGTFLIDPKGTLQNVTINNLDVGRSVDETVRTLEAFQTGGLCPANWKAGEANLKV